MMEAASETNGVASPATAKASWQAVEPYKKVEASKYGRSKTWSLLLTFPDGNTEAVKTKHTDKKKAVYSGIALWTKAARLRGFLPARPKGFGQPHRKKASNHAASTSPRKKASVAPRLRLLLTPNEPDELMSVFHDVLKALQPCLTDEERQTVLFHASAFVRLSGGRP